MERLPFLRITIYNEFLSIEFLPCFLFDCTWVNCSSLLSRFCDFSLSVLLNCPLFYHPLPFPIDAYTVDFFPVPVSCLLSSACFLLCLAFILKDSDPLGIKNIALLSVPGLFRYTYVYILTYLYTCFYIYIQKTTLYANCVWSINKLNILRILFYFWLFTVNSITISCFKDACNSFSG